MYKRTPTRVPLDGTEATLVDTSWPVNKDHKISNPATPIGRPRSRGHGAWRPIGWPPRGCEDVLNDAPQCTWLTKADLPRGSLAGRGTIDRKLDTRTMTMTARRLPLSRERAFDVHTHTRTSAHTPQRARLPNLPHSKNGRTQNNTARAVSRRSSTTRWHLVPTLYRLRPSVREIARFLHHLRDARQRTYASCVASAASNRRPVNEIENDGRVHCGHYGGESGRPPGHVKNETLRGAIMAGRYVYTRAHAAHGGIFIDSERSRTHTAHNFSSRFFSLSSSRAKFLTFFFFLLSHSYSISPALFSST